MQSYLRKPLSFAEFAESVGETLHYWLRLNGRRRLCGWASNSSMKGCDGPIFVTADDRKRDRRYIIPGRTPVVALRGTGPFVDGSGTTARHYGEPMSSRTSIHRLDGGLVAARRGGPAGADGPAQARRPDPHAHHGREAVLGRRVFFHQWRIQRNASTNIAGCWTATTSATPRARMKSAWPRWSRSSGSEAAAHARQGRRRAARAGRQPLPHGRAVPVSGGSKAATRFSTSPIPARRAT